MNHFVIDTNVLMTADGQAPQAPPECVLRSIDALAEAKNGRICIDDGMRILDEYTQNLGYAGQPGAGKAFVKWVWENQANPEHSERLPIHDNSERVFDEFPADPELEGFDINDRKFVAVALTSLHKPEILNAVDQDWWDYKEPLRKNGVKIRFIHPEQFV